MTKIFSKHLLGRIRTIVRRCALDVVIAQVLVVGFLVSCASVANPREYGGYHYDYYCPVSDVTLAASELELRLFGHAYVRFPQSVPETGEATINWFGASLKDCSTTEFACFEVEGRNASHSFYLFVPRRLEAKREYRLHGARAVTAFATAPHIDAIQVTLWQPPSNAMPPMKLTIEKSRGVVFWSGVSFWNNEGSDSGETCILQSRKGLFNQVDVLLPQTREIVPD